jgi:capsular polysaccharide biosynthesis protein
MMVPPGGPMTVTVIQDAIFIPGHHCLYDSAGYRIRESCLLRGPRLQEVARKTVERIEIPSDLDVQEADIIFGGWMPPHWGHFLTEGIARLWVLRHRPPLAGLPLLFTSLINDLAPIRDFFAVGRIPAEAVTTFTKPTLARRIHLPSATFRNRGTADPLHLDLPHVVATQLKADTYPPWGTSSQPVYLSRTALQGNRRFHNEDALQQHLKSRGFLVIHPERLSLNDQVRVVNEHNIFVGCWGSAFHTLAFRVDPTPPETHVICELNLNRNFHLFDALIGIRANYIQAARVAPGQPDEPASERILDARAVLSHLARFGLV